MLSRHRPGVRELGWCCVLAAAVCRGEIIDRVAVTIGPGVITESELRREIRITAFLDGKELDFGSAAKRAAGDRLIDQRLIRREIETSRFPLSSDPEATERLLQEVRGKDSAKYIRTLEKYGLNEEELKTHLLWQLTTVQFVSFRFRAGVQIRPEEIDEYYAREILPKLPKSNGEDSPPADEHRAQIEQILIEERANRQADVWLKETRGRTHIEFREEAFR